MSKIKTFRGLLEDGGQDTIYLAGDLPADGYRIKNLTIMGERPGAETYESIVQVFSVKQSVVGGVINFDDDSLLASAYYESNSGAGSLPFYTMSIVDHVVVNQNIYVTHSEVNGSNPINYQLELEQIKMSKGEQAVANFKAALLHTE